MAMGAMPQGRLRITSTVAFGRTQLAPILPSFMAANPDLKISLELSDRTLDLVAESIDVAIRFSEQIDDPSVVSRRLARNRRLICAAPSYIDRFGAPATIDDLALHNCLRLSTVATWNDWRFGPADAPITVQAGGNFEANSADAIRSATLAGMGIARLPTYLIGDDLKAGRLVRVLPNLVDEETDIVAVYAERQNLPAKIRVFVDHIVSHFTGTPPWERTER